jgi:hypothetical protein
MTEQVTSVIVKCVGRSDIGLKTIILSDSVWYSRLGLGGLWLWSDKKNNRNKMRNRKHANGEPSPSR